ncbi:hypothetical protein [Paraliobacillus ryukyuensis]|uniref:hypothetical protein n=1 Tax=Paraliobacillus ryukyuensis TaxID=200904 RepID=UPI0015C4CB02|nr:hypothetical protein [Paraliobacillus ryukyuensis]
MTKLQLLLNKYHALDQEQITDIVYAYSDLDKAEILEELQELFTYLDEKIG